MNLACTSLKSSDSIISSAEEIRERLLSISSTFGDSLNIYNQLNNQNNVNMLYFKNMVDTTYQVLNSILDDCPQVPNWANLLELPDEYNSDFRGSLIDPNGRLVTEMKSGKIAFTSAYIDAYNVYNNKVKLFKSSAIVSALLKYKYVNHKLYSALGHKEPSIFCSAAISLGLLGEKRAINVIKNMAFVEKEVHYFRVLLISLKSFGDKEADEALAEIKLKRNGDEKYGNVIKEIVSDNK
jgi:HEAT repeat protein